MFDGYPSSNTPGDKPVGVPRRFAVGTALIIMAMYSVLFAVLRWLGASPGLFTSIAVFLTGVGGAQMLMFRGRRPRDASCVAGALLFPLILLAACLVAWQSGRSPPLLNVILLLPYQCAVGVLLGYLAGCPTAGVFLILGRIDEALHGPRAEPAVVADGSDPGIQSRLSWDERLYNRSRRVLSVLRPYHRGRPIGDAASLVLIVLVFAGPIAPNFARGGPWWIQLLGVLIAGLLLAILYAGSRVFGGLGLLLMVLLGGVGGIALHTLLEHVFYFTDHPLDRYIPLWLAITLGCLLGGLLLIVVAVYHHLRFRRQRPYARPSFRVTGAAVALLAVIYASASLALLTVSKQPRQRAMATVYRLRDYRSERLLWRTTPFQMVVLSADTVDDDLKYVAAINELRFLRLQNSKVTDDGLRHLQGLTSLTRLDLLCSQVTDNGLEHLKELPRLKSLVLGGSTTDAGLSHLKGLTKLAILDLAGTQVTDAGLKHLQGLPNLRELDLQGTRVTDAGLENLKGLTKLETLNLSDTQVTDAGLSHLEGLPNLDILNLGGTQVTDAGLKHLTGLTKLHRLDLQGTQVTSEAAEKFREARPDCSVLP